MPRVTVVPGSVDVRKLAMRISYNVMPPWFVLWLFTVGFGDLDFWQGVLATLIWPYYFGDSL